MDRSDTDRHCRLTCKGRGRVKRSEYAHYELVPVLRGHMTTGYDVVCIGPERPLVTHVPRYVLRDPERFPDIPCDSWQGKYRR
jgi:hypothetical protein